jgi:uncharacterized protein DUF4350
MPLGIAASDRKLLFIGGGLLVLMLAITVILSPPGEQFDSPVPSTYSTQSAGAQAAYLLLSELHYPVRRWEDPPTELPANSNGILLILAEPLEATSAKERKALEDFVKGGGHVLFTGPNIHMFFSDADISEILPDPGWKSFSPSLPSRIARGAGHVTIRPQAYWGRFSESQLVLYGETDSAVVVSWNIGHGQVLWWAGSTPLNNAGITREQNLAFFLNSVARWSTAQPYSILWDEYFHGQRSSLWSYFGKTSLAWGVFQLGVLTAAVLFTFSRRSGPVYLPAGVTRLSPLEFVDTLGGLYERAGAASSAVCISYLRLRSLLLRQLALPSKTPDGELGHAAEQRLGWKDQGIAELLVRAEASGHLTKLSPRTALDLVQKLDQQTARLTLRAPSRREKN